MAPRLRRGRTALARPPRRPFRNALDPGQYPYPFWHDARKWHDYQSANTLILWIALQPGNIVVGQFISNSQRDPSLKSAPVARPPLDGQWSLRTPCARGTATNATFRTTPVA